MDIDKVNQLSSAVYSLASGGSMSFIKIVQEVSGYHLEHAELSDITHR